MKFKNQDLHDLFIETLSCEFMYPDANLQATNKYLFLQEFIISEKIIAGEVSVYKVYVYMQKIDLCK